MEPGLRDREYEVLLASWSSCRSMLQWSPVLETGNTRNREVDAGCSVRAAMEPGLRDREYASAALARAIRILAAMEPGLRDREYVPGARWRKQQPAPAAMEPGLRDREYGSTQNPLLATSLAGLRERCQPALGQGAAGAPAGGGKHGSD